MNLVLDFDSTIIQAESLDVLADICNFSSDIRKEISEITKLGMEGEITMQDSLSRRIALLNASIHDIPDLVSRLLPTISPSLSALKNLSDIFPDKCYVVSGGFKEYILPICQLVGFKEDHIIANQFVLKNKRIVDFRKDLTIASHLGKVKVINQLDLQRPIFMIGDGFTDLETKLEGAVDYFLAFTETVYRESTVAQADMECKNFGDVVEFLNSLHE